MMTTDNLDIPALLSILEKNLNKLILSRNIKRPIMIGIHSGGTWIAKYLHQKLSIEEPLGMMDISFYRDDFSQIGMNPSVKPSQLPTQMEARDIILIDDVFYTGRTSRAALNEIFDYGRPNQVILGVLIERDGRQVPLRPDCSGCSITLPAGQRIQLTGPDPLGIHIQALDKQTVIA